MRLPDLVRRGLWHHRRRHLGVALGTAVAAGVLVGALAVGDSVRASLRAQALARIGPVDAALSSGDRLFRTALADELAAAAPGVAELAPILALDGAAALPDGSARAHGVRVFGVDRRFFALAGRGTEPDGAARPGPREALLSRGLARRLGLATGDVLVVRVEPPSAVPRDMVLAPNEEASRALRLTVLGVLEDEELGAFALHAGPTASLSVFCDLAWLQLQLESEGRANLILAAGAGGLAAPAVARRLDRELARVWTLEDGELELVPTARGELELRTRRVFLDPQVASAPALAGGTGILTYFVNALEANGRSAPYSMVAAVGPAPASALSEVVPADLGGDEVVINDWLARSLGAGPGDELTLRYFALGPSRRLVEERAAFRVRSIVPLEGPAADPRLMPDFPGLADAEHCRDWEAGVPIDLEAVGDEDEAYWDEHRGTPKAFLALAAGERLWSNRYGGLTAVRVPGGEPQELTARLRDQLDPSLFGLSLRDLRTPALAAASPATDFGGLFLGLSLFLLGAALLLAGMLFALGVESRAGEVGTLAAVGFPAARIRRLFLLEGGIVALFGSLLGVLLGLGYTRGVLAGLATVWRGAVGGLPLELRTGAASLVGGAGAAALSAWLAMRLALRGLSRRPAAELVRAAAGEDAAPVRPGWIAPTACALALVGAVALALATPGAEAPGSSAASRAGAFFGVGALVLVAGLFGLRALLARRSVRDSGHMVSLRSLGSSAVVRRPGRSLATVALLASGSFLVLSVGVHHRGSEARPGERGSGTGGFALLGRASLPVLVDLNGAAGREAFGLDEGALAGVSVVPLRVRQGDDASCLQLGVPQAPELLGVDPQALAERGAFSFAGTLGEVGEGSPWLLLDRPQPDGAVPAVADAASATWTMKKGLGDSFEYLDERGERFTVRLVATVSGSILQGSLVVPERALEARFPSLDGHRAFLIDAPAGRADEVAATLSRALSDVGLELTPTAARLAELDRVQNTYLLVFQLLGGLGLLLGSAGLGLVVLRNALERRAELAALRAVGFRRSDVRRLLLFEHLGLFASGLGLGALAAAVAWVPVAARRGASLPGSVPLWLAALAASGFVWVSLASRVASRGPLIDALRDE